MKYLHLICLDKFTEGFIEFIRNNFDVNEHIFIVYGDNEFMFSPDKYDGAVYFLKHHNDLKADEHLKSLFYSAKLIIVNGVFGSHNCFLHLPRKLLSKTYFMFWGGDIYDMRYSKSPGQIMFVLLKKHFIRNSAGVINLIEGDYGELKKFVKLKSTRRFVAPMAGSGINMELYKKYRPSEKCSSPLRILVGNSATSTNNHFEVFEILKKYADEDIEVMCPLSYGDEGYRDSVIELGKKYFDNKFTALIDYMSKESYFKLLSSVSIGIFNNNRQQAMGNINALIAMGSKVFIRNDTGMWNKFHNTSKYNVYDIASIRDLEFSEFTEFSSEKADENWEKFLKVYDNESFVRQWKAVFDSIDEK